MLGKIVFFSACACVIATAHAAPHTPASGAQVLERLPGGLDPARRELQGLRAALGANPNTLDLATTLAQRYIEQSRRDGDPRYLGYAQAALAPWWTQPQPPSQVLVLRATLRQSTHQFAPALTDLDTVLKRDSGNSQAWLTRATVQLITGDFSGARASCMRLYSRAPELVVQTCLSSIGSVSGQAAASYEQLLRAPVKSPVIVCTVARVSQAWALPLSRCRTVSRSVKAAPNWWVLWRSVARSTSTSAGGCGCAHQGASAACA